MLNTLLITKNFTKIFIFLKDKGYINILIINYYLNYYFYF